MLHAFLDVVSFTNLFVSHCPLILQLEMILPDRAYAFFSHTHKAQKENMPLLDKVCCCCIVVSLSDGLSF